MGAKTTPRHGVARVISKLGLGSRTQAAQWVREGDTYLPFITPGAVQRYQARHPGAVAVSYDQAIGEVRS